MLPCRLAAAGDVLSPACSEDQPHVSGKGVSRKVLRRDYGVEADMWSLGVMLYILLSGLPPFWGDDESQIFKSVLKVRSCHGLGARA